MKQNPTAAKAQTAAGAGDTGVVEVEDEIVSYK